MRLLRAALALLLAGTATTAASGCAAEPVAEEDVAAETADAYTASLMPREVNRRVATCFAQGWASKRLTTRSAPAYSNRGAITTVASSLGYVTFAVINSYGYLLMIGSEGERVLSQLERDVKQISEEQGLAPHQRAMVVSCVTSQLITYSFSALSKFMGTATAASNYEGVCTEYARVASRLMKAADLEAGVQLGTLDGGGHAWNWVSLEGKQYWMEPQSNPLRLTGGFFIDPTGKTEGDPQYLACVANGNTAESDALCCSGARSSKGTCAPTACEATGVGLCTATATDCTGIGGTTARQSCGASKDGSVCCALPSAR